MNSFSLKLKYDIDVVNEAVQFLVNQSEDFSIHFQEIEQQTVYSDTTYSSEETYSHVSSSEEDGEDEYSTSNFVLEILDGLGIDEDEVEETQAYTSDLYKSSVETQDLRETLESLLGTRTLREREEKSDDTSEESKEDFQDESNELIYTEEYSEEQSDLGNLLGDILEETSEEEYEESLEETSEEESYEESLETAEEEYEESLEETSDNYRNAEEYEEVDDYDEDDPYSYEDDPYDYEEDENEQEEESSSVTFSFEGDDTEFVVEKTRKQEEYEDSDESSLEDDLIEYESNDFEENLEEQEDFEEDSEKFEEDSTEYEDNSEELKETEVDIENYEDNSEVSRAENGLSANADFLEELTSGDEERIHSNDRAEMEEKDRKIAYLQKLLFLKEKQEALKKKERELNNKSKEQVKKDELDKTLEKVYKNTDELYRDVKAFMVENGVDKRTIPSQVLVDEFGERNIKELRLKSYIIKIGNGYTVGI